MTSVNRVPHFTVSEAYHHEDHVFLESPIRLILVCPGDTADI